MTTRQSLNRSLRRTFLIGSVGGVLLVIGSATDHGSLGFVGFIVFGIGILSMWVTGRCRQCDENIGVMLSARGGPWRILDQIRYCPCCGKSIDEE
ncbi:MAG TPA: hypothetical protein VIM46_01575 [Luteolibacter sp.]